MDIQNFCFQVCPSFSTEQLDKNILSRQFDSPLWNLSSSLFPDKFDLKKKKYELKFVEKKSVPDSAISEEKLNKLTTAQPVELEYKNKIYEYLVEYTDSITYIHSTKKQWIDSMRQTRCGRRRVGKCVGKCGRKWALKVPGETGKPFD